MEIYIILLVIIQYLSFIYNLEYVSRKIKDSKTMNDYYYYKTIRLLFPSTIFLILLSVSYYHDIKSCGLIVFLFLLITSIKLIPILFIR